MATMIRVVFAISLAVAVGAKDVNRTSDEIPNEPHNLGWLFSPDTQGLNSASIQAQSERSVCQTDECKDIAQKLLRSMNKSADPCENFYEYTCGNWGKHNKPEDKDSPIWNLLVMLQEKVSTITQEMLTAPIKPDDVLAVKLTKKWYAACMDTDSIEKRGLEPLLSTLARIGGWPVAMEPEMWDSDAYRWQKVDDYYARLIGYNAFHHVGVLKDTKEEETVYQLRIGTPRLPDNTRMLFRVLNDNDVFDEEERDDGDEDEGNGNDKSDDDCQDCDDNDSDDKDVPQEIIEGDSVSEDSDEPEVRLVKKKISHKIRKNRGKEKERNVKQVKTKQEKTHKHKVGATKKKLRHRAVKKIDHVQKQFDKMLKKRTKRSSLPANLHHRFQHHELKKHKERLTKSMRFKKQEKNKLSSGETDTATTIIPDCDEDKDEADVPLLKQYYELITLVVQGIAKTAGTDGDPDDIHEQVKNIIMFQLDLQRISLSEIDADEENNNMTLQEFQEWYDNLDHTSSVSKVDWIDKIKNLLNEATDDHDPSEAIVMDKKYFEDLNKLLEETSPRTIVNYIHWAYITNMLMATSEEMRTLYSDWVQVGSLDSDDDDHDNGDDDDDDDDDDDKWRKLKSASLNHRHMQCIRQERISELVGYEYVKQYFPDNITAFASDLFDDIQKESEYQIKDAQWMDENTRDIILSKLVRMKKQIGFPDWYKNETLVKQHLRGITVGSSYFENILSYQKFEKSQEMRRLVVGHENDLDEFYISPLTVNAMFLGGKNSITITAVDFLSPLFAFGRPNNVNFPLVGSIISHEVNHGFDHDGYSVDKDGKDLDWKEEIRAQYNKRAACFIRQYDEYVSQVTTANVMAYGNRTLDENIADTMGLRAVYKAYKRRERECGAAAQALPGMEEFSNDQIFFLSYGYVWCETINPKFRDMLLKYIGHSIGRLRVIGPVSNLEEFATAFKCPANSPMNPEEKCNIWK